MITDDGDDEEEEDEVDDDDEEEDDDVSDVDEHPIYFTYHLYAPTMPCYREFGHPVFVTMVNGVKIKCMVSGLSLTDKVRSIKGTSTTD